MVYDVLAVCQERFANHNVELRVLPIPQGLIAQLHSGQIQQLLGILLNNAFDTVQALDKKWVELEVNQDQDSVFFFITDSGSGIPIHLGKDI